MKRETARVYAWRAKQEALPLDDPRHGLYSSYQNYRCRCAKCKRANADYMRRYRRDRKRQEPNEDEQGELA